MVGVILLSNVIKLPFQVNTHTYTIAFVCSAFVQDCEDKIKEMMMAMKSGILLSVFNILSHCQSDRLHHK